jgi:hypothetical protein
MRRGAIVIRRGAVLTLREARLMVDDIDEIRFLREKATKLRALARKDKPPLDNELIQIAQDFERLASDLERRR